MSNLDDIDRLPRKIDRYGTWVRQSQAAEIAARADARIADMTTCALRNIPADWRPGYAWTDDCVMNVLSEYVVEIQDRAARADARIAELERDAARYRWLRRKVYVVGLHHLSDNDCGQFEFANLPRILEPMAGVSNAADALDAVIDAALSEVKS